MDLLTRAIEQAKQLQQLATDAVQAGAEQAKPLVADAVAKAQDLQKTLKTQAPQTAAAAHEHLDSFIATGKTVMEAGAAQAQPHLQRLADQAKSFTAALRPKGPGSP